VRLATHAGQDSSDCLGLIKPGGSGGTMKDWSGKLRRGWFSCGLALSLALAALPAAGQNQPGQPGTQPEESANENLQPATTQAPEPAYRHVPATLTLKPGTVITARTSQFLSSDKNKPGDSFSAVLEQPVVVDGWVVARRGQTVLGRVAIAKKAGRIKGTSQLGIELSELVLVDGQQLPIRSQLLQDTGGTSKGRDAAATATTTAMGAAIGGAANGGEGAGIGAAIGAGAGLAGVLLTRGRATMIPPETSLTFQLQYPVAISTANSGPAFRQVVPEDYDNRSLQRRPGRYAEGPYSLPPYGPYFGPWAYYYPAPFFVGFYGFGRRGYRHW
jgi:hypothetical protein